MSIKFSDKTLAYYQSLPLTRFVNGQEIMVSEMAPKSKVFVNQSGKVIPEREAVSFYTMNHLVAEISKRHHKHEPLDDFFIEVLREYHTKLSHSAARAFHYLLLICIRESRHSHWAGNSFQQCGQKFGLKVADFFKNSGGEEGIHQRYYNNPPNTTLGNFTQCLSWIFYNAGFSSGYGGPKWGNVADCLMRYVAGVSSAEMMLDTNWTLVHNGGPIFNKGYLYEHHAGLPTLTRILDCQRAGVMPTAIMRDTKIGTYKEDWVGKTVNTWHSTIEPIIEDKVDWQKVMDLGSVGQYAVEVGKSPAQKHGQFPIIGTKPIATGGTMAATPAVTYNKETHYQAMPGVLVPKTPRIKKKV